MFLILVGARTVLGGPSGTDEPDLEGAAEAAKEAAFDFFPAPFPTGAEMEHPAAGFAVDALFSSAFDAARAVLNSDSCSPTQDRTNQRPPPIPRISRCATRQ